MDEFSARREAKDTERRVNATVYRALRAMVEATERMFPAPPHGTATVTLPGPPCADAWDAMVAARLSLRAVEEMNAAAKGVL